MFLQFGEYAGQTLSKIETQTLSKTALNFFRLRRQVFIFFKLCLEAIPVKKSEREKLCANFEHKSARLPTAPKRKNCFLCRVNVRFSRFLFSLAEITLLAFPFLRLAAKRYKSASFKSAKTQKFEAF